MDWADRLASTERLRNSKGWRELCRFDATPALVALIAPGGRPVYLATPYSQVSVDERGHWSEPQSERAICAAIYESGRLIERGLSLLSPIAIAGTLIHTNRLHGWGFNIPDPLDGKAWGRWCWPLLDACGAVVVPDLPGVLQSEGVLQEVTGAIERNRLVFFYQSLRP